MTAQPAWSHSKLCALVARLLAQEIDQGGLGTHVWIGECQLADQTCLCVNWCPPRIAAILRPQRDQELAAAIAAAASAREGSSLPTSPTARSLRTNLSGGPHSTGSVSSPMAASGINALVTPGHTTGDSSLLLGGQPVCSSLPQVLLACSHTQNVAVRCCGCKLLVRPAPGNS